MGFYRILQTSVLGNSTTSANPVFAMGTMGHYVALSSEEPILWHYGSLWLYTVGPRQTLDLLMNTRQSRERFTGLKRRYRPSES